MNNTEKHSLSPETKKDHEALKDLQEAGAKRHEQLRKNLERSGEISHENIDDTLHEALDKATSKEKLADKHETNREISPAEKRHSFSKAEKAAGFKTIMSETQSQMSAPSRTFSKIIHNKAIERVSEVTGNTVARPDAILSGAVFAFLMTLGVYLVAKNLGYPLSGFETIGAFALGWVLGITFDFVKVMVTGRK